MSTERGTIRNERFEVSLSAEDRTLTLCHRGGGALWRSDAPFLRFRKPAGAPDRDAPDWYWGKPDPVTLLPWTSDQLTIVEHERRIELVVSGIPAESATVRVALSIALEIDRVVFSVDSVDGLAPGEELIIDFPWRLGVAAAGTDGWLIIPRGAGVMADFDEERPGHVVENFIYSGGQNGYSMPIFGVTRGGDALGAIIRTPHDCLLRAELNAGDTAAYAASPCWLFEGGRLMEPRRVDSVSYTHLTLPTNRRCRSRWSPYH